MCIRDRQNNRGAEALAKLTAAIEKPKSDIHKQMAMFFKGMVTMDVTRDAEAAVALLEGAKAIAPKSPIAEQIDQVLPQIKVQAGGGK